MQIMLLLFVCIVWGDRISEQNYHLKAANRILLRTLRSLTVDTEKTVGDEATIGWWMDLTDDGDGEIEEYPWFPDVCKNINTVGVVVDTASFTGDETVCPGGQVLVAGPMCCPLTFWRTFTYPDTAEKEVGYRPSSLNAERAVGQWTSIHGGDCTPDELADANCRTVMKPLGPVNFPTCECLDTAEKSVGHEATIAWTGGGYDFPNPPLPSGCDYLSKVGIRAETGAITGYESSCKGGEILVGVKICCSISVWENFKFPDDATDTEKNVAQYEGDNLGTYTGGMTIWDGVIGNGGIVRSPPLPSQCGNINTLGTMATTSGLNPELVCPGGYVMAGSKICCPMSFWETYKFST